MFEGTVRLSSGRASLGLQRPEALGLAATVAIYLGIVLLLPLSGIGAALVQMGPAAVWRALVEPAALSALRMSLVLAVIAVAVNACVGTAGALLLVRGRFFGRKWVNALADLPLAVSPVVAGLAFLLLFGQDGWFAGPLRALGLRVLFAFPGLVLATLFVTVPFTIREVAYVLEELGTSEEEAAATLGASPWQTFWHVTLPNVREALVYGLLMTLARSLGEFGAVLILGGSVSGQTQTATTFIHDAVEERNLPAAYGMAFVLGAIAVGLLFGLEVLKQRRETKRA